MAPPALPESVAWSTTVEEPAVGDVVVRGPYARGGGDTLVICIHGLGGSPDSAYHTPIVRAAAERGWSSLRLGLRGTDGIGNDFYHAGLTADVHAALADETFAGYDTVFVVGFSLGGHIAMCLAADLDVDPRVRAVVAVCPPVDLAAGATKLDERGQIVYRRHILGELKSMYRAVSRVAPVPTPWSRVRQVRYIREWDALTIVPRFGFLGVDDYYRRAAIAHRMVDIALPTLMVHSHDDPVVLPETVYPVLERAPRCFEAYWFARAGHVFFPPTLDLGQRGERGLGAQVLEWCAGHG